MEQQILTHMNSSLLNRKTGSPLSQLYQSIIIIENKAQSSFRTWLINVWCKRQLTTIIVRASRLERSNWSILAMMMVLYRGKSSLTHGADLPIINRVVRNSVLDPTPWPVKVRTFSSPKILNSIKMDRRLATSSTRMLALVALLLFKAKSHWDRCSMADQFPWPSVRSSLEKDIRPIPCKS